MTQHRRIDQESPKRVDQPHVPRREATHRLNVDPPIESVVRGTLQQREDGKRVDRGVLDLRDSLPRGYEEDPERPFGGPGRNQGRRAIGGRELVKEAGRRCLGRLAVPAEDSSKPAPKPEEEVHRRVRGPEILRGEESPKLEDGTTGTASGKIDRPDIVQGDIREQRMRPQFDSLVLLRRHAHGARLVRDPDDAQPGLRPRGRVIALEWTARAGTRSAGPIAP